MTATKPYIGRRRARPGPSSKDSDERNYYIWRCIGSAMHWGLPFASAIWLAMKVFNVSEGTARRAYRENNGRPTTDRNALHYMTPEPFEIIEREVRRHMPEMIGRLRGSTGIPASTKD